MASHKELRNLHYWRSSTAAGFVTKERNPIADVCESVLLRSPVVRMDKSRLPRRLLTAWVREPRQEFGQEMSYGRSLERWLKLFDLPLRYTEWATLAQDRAEWARLITRKRPH